MNEAISDAIPTMPPIIGPNSTAATYTELNLSEILIEAPILHVAKKPNTIVSATSMPKIHNCLNVNFFIIKNPFCKLLQKGN